MTAVTPEADLMARLAARGGRTLAVGDVIAHLTRWDPGCLPVEVFLGPRAAVIVTAAPVPGRTRALLLAWAAVGTTLIFEERA